MTERPNILVICGRNKKRSRTAGYIFKNDNRFGIRSAGLSTKSDRVVNEHDLKWADFIFVMVPEQRARLNGQFGYLDLPPIEVLYIEDEYEFMDEELVDILKHRINSTLKSTYQI